MKISNQELNICKIINITKGTIYRGATTVESRFSDCFVYVTSGWAEYKFGDNIVRACKGDIIYLSYKSRYDIKISVDDYQFINIDFSFEDLGDHPYENCVYTSVGIALMEKDFIKFLKYWNMGSFSEKISCKSIIYKIYAEIVASCSYSYIPSNTIKQVNKAIEVMLSQYTDSAFSVDKLSKLCGVSEVHFRRIFHQIYQTSPVKFLISLRINKAKERLAMTQLSVAEISEVCGFNNAYYFSKKFKELVGVTPSEYRTSMKL